MNALVSMLREEKPESARRTPPVRFVGVDSRAGTAKWCVPHFPSSIPAAGDF